MDAEQTRVLERQRGMARTVMARAWLALPPQASQEREFEISLSRFATTSSATSSGWHLKNSALQPSLSTVRAVCGGTLNLRPMHGASWPGALSAEEISGRSD